MTPLTSTVIALLYLITHAIYSKNNQYLSRRKYFAWGQSCLESREGNGIRPYYGMQHDNADSLLTENSTMMI